MTDDGEDFVELSPKQYLLDLAERLRRIPVTYGINGYDIDHLAQIAKIIQGDETK